MRPNQLSNYTKIGIDRELREILDESLGIDGEDVSHTSQLEADLGAESIDFMDIMYKMEQRFSFKTNYERMFPEDLSPEENTVGRLYQIAEEELKAQKRLDYTPK